MDQRLYITQLPGSLSESELNTWLEKKLNAPCSTSLRRGKIPNTHIAFVSIGNYNADKAINMLNNSEFRGTRIRVMPYVQTEKNKNYASVKRYTNDVSTPAPAQKEKAHTVSPKVSKSTPNSQPSPVSYSGAMVFITSSSEFYIQEVSDLGTLTTINSYMDLLDNQTMSESSEPVDIVVGKVCAARYSLDNKFYRALIQSEEAKGNVAVQFVDFGNKETVERDTLTSLPTHITKLDFVAKRCCFHQLKILNEEKALSFMREAGERFNIVLYNEGSVDNGFKTWEVDLQDEASGLSLRQKLVDLGYARLEVKSEPSYELTSPPVVQSRSQDTSELIPHTTCIISHVESAERFFLQGAFGQSHLAEIYQCLLTATSLPEIKTEEASPSKIYAAIFSKDGTWYRCRLRDDAPSKGSGDAPTVCFIDFGNSECLTGNLRLLPENVAAIPPQAVLCQLPDLRLTNPVKVKTELTQLGNNEMPLRCHLQKSSGPEAVNVDFAVEGKFPSFCSWVIENRWAERIYKRNQRPTPPSTNNSTPRFVPTQVSRRQTMEPSPSQAATAPPAASSSGGHKRTGPRSKSGPVRNANWSPRSAGTDSGNDSSERPAEVLSTELLEAFNLRQTLDSWRDALCHGEKSLVQRLSKLRKMRNEGENSVASDEVVAYQHLTTLRDAAAKVRADLCKSIQEIKATLSAAPSNEDNVLAMAERRDELAKQLVESVRKFLNEVESNEEVLKEHSVDAEALVKKIDFFLKQRTVRRISEVNGHVDTDASCEKIWNEYETSNFFEQRFAETEICSKQLEEIREILGQVTGVFNRKEEGSDATGVTSFFEKLKALNCAMAQEVNAYSVHFLSGVNGEQMTAYLERHLALAREFKEDVQQLERHCDVVHDWEKEATRILEGLQILSDGTIACLEDMTTQRKKARSKLRHLLADLEDEEEAMNAESEQLESLRGSIAKVRCELHTILDRENDMKKSVSDALELRPELAIQLKKILKGDASLIDDTSIISSWETSYFDMVPLESKDNCFFSSKFKDQEVFIQKILLTPENRVPLQEMLRRYQQIASSSKALAPLLAAFVPPRDSHVLYLVSPGLDLMREVTCPTEVLKMAHTLLSAFLELRSKDVFCSMARPMQFFGRLNSDPEQRVVLLPNFTSLESSTDNDLRNVVDFLNKEPASESTPPALVNILNSISALADIPDALNRINKLLQMLTSPIQVSTDRVETAEAPAKSESLAGDIDDDVDMDLIGDDEDGIEGNGHDGVDAEVAKDDSHFTPVVVVEKLLDESSN